MSSMAGKDSLGSFKIYFGLACGVCGGGKRDPHGHNVIYQVIYLNKPKVSDYVAKAPSLLIRNKKTKNFIRTIGINCGCYAKIHRQIAHIEGGKN